MEDECGKMLRHLLERFRFALINISDRCDAAVLRELIAEAEAQLREIDRRQRPHS